MSSLPIAIIVTDYQYFFVIIVCISAFVSAASRNTAKTQFRKAELLIVMRNKLA